jgi:hypothetical protein
MPRDEFFEKKKEHEDYSFQVETSLEASSAFIHEDQMEERRIGEDNYDAQALDIENDRIMGRLKDRELLSEISDDMRERLMAQDLTRLTRNNAILLYGDKRDSQDSGLMEEIKKGLKDLDVALRIPMKNGPEDVYRKYETVIGLMDTYVGSKHPMFPDGKRRKAKTAELKDNLTAELARFKAVMAEQAAGVGGLPQEMRVPMDVLEGKYLSQNENGDLSEKLDERKLQLFSLKHKNGDADGKDMKAIKAEFKKLTGLLEGNVEGDKEAFRQKRETIYKSYEDLIGRCNDYIGSHDPGSAEGKRRLREVKELKERYILERDYIATVAKEMLKEKEGHVTWKEVFGQTTVMAEECMTAKRKTEVSLGDRPKMKNILNLFESMSLMNENHPYRYKMLPEVVMTDWLEKHFDKGMIDDLITERFKVMDELATRYKRILEKPVPKEYLKNPDDDPMDLKIRKNYARLVMAADPAFKSYRMINRMGNTLTFGIDKKKSLFKDESFEVGEYYLERGAKRRMAMSEADGAYADEIGQIATEISNNIYKELDAEAVKTHTEDLHKLEQAQAQRNLSNVIRLKAKARYMEFEDPIEEQANIQKTMNVVQGKAFVPVQRPADRMGTWAKVKNRLMVGYRFMVSATLGNLGSLVLNSYYGAKKLLFEGDEKKKAQNKRRHDLVPGRKGEVFEDEVVPKNEYGEDTEVYSDVRRGPLIFEKLSAGDPEDPPEVTIMSAQSERGKTTAFGVSGTHAFIGLSYSRYNRMTRRKERYQLRIGFFPGGGLTKGTAPAMAGGAMVAGQINSDYANTYDVARRYQVKPGDINKILRAAEKYADKGYGYYKRNCSTFLVEMSKLIDLPIAKDFKEEEMKYVGKSGVGIETGAAISKAGYYMGADAISKRMNKMDLSYQNFGQKMFTKEDLKRYYKTAGKADTIKKGYNPGTVGETIRNAKTGELTANYDEHSAINSDMIGDVITETGEKLWKEFEKVLPKRIWTNRDLEMQTSLLMAGDGGLSKLNSDSKPDDVREVYKKVRDAMKLLNSYYADVLGSDASLNLPVMNLLSLYESALTYADRFYQIVIRKAAVGDAGKLRADFADKEYEISFTGTDLKRVRTKMAPGVYEGYLMIGKTPEQAVREHKRLRDLEAKKEKPGGLSKEEKKEKSRLSRTLSLAQDFASANRYLLEKETYSEKDYDYAFSKLPAMEKGVKQDERMGGKLIANKSASITYQGVILERVFGGFQGLKLTDIKDQALLKQNIDDYTEKQLELNRDMVQKILKAYIRDKNDKTEDLASGFIDIIGIACIESAYGGPDGFWGMGDEVDSLSELLTPDCKLKGWLVREIDTIRNAGGGQ